MSENDKTDLEQSALAVYFANCQGIKSDPLPMLRKILALGEGEIAKWKARAEYAEARLEAGQRISMAYEPSGSGEGRGPHPTGQGFGAP